MLAEFFEDLADAFVTKDDDTTVRQYERRTGVGLWTPDAMLRGGAPASQNKNKTELKEST
jgi:hypothetical protein